MSIYFERSSLTNGSQNYAKNGTATNKPKKRLFEWTIENNASSDNNPQKLGEQDAINQSNHVGVIVWCLVFTIVIVKFALYIGMENISFKDVGASVQDTIESQFFALIEKISKIRVNFMNMIVCGLIGTIVTAFSWMIIYLDSDVPGINPPTPLSPRKNRTGYQMHVKQQYSLSYLMTILNGFAVFMFLLIGS